MQNKGFSSPGFLSSEAQTASQRDVTLRFVYSAMHCHRHVDKDKYITTRMFDVLFDRTQARPLVLRSHGRACRWVRMSAATLEMHANLST